MYSLAITSKRHHLNLMVADHHKSRAMLISRQCERCTRREYSAASTRGDLRASTRGEYSRQCEIALRCKIIRIAWVEVFSTHTHTPHMVEQFCARTVDWKVWVLLVYMRNVSCLVGTGFFICSIWAVTLETQSID